MTITYAFYNGESYKDAQDALDHGGLYESSNPLTYNDEASRADIEEIIATMRACCGVDIRAVRVADNGTMKEVK